LCCLYKKKENIIFLEAQIKTYGEKVLVLMPIGVLAFRIEKGLLKI
jgi:hypothetical protein